MNREMQERPEGHSKNAIIWVFFLFKECQQIFFYDHPLFVSLYKTEHFTLFISKIKDATVEKNLVLTIKGHLRSLVFQSVRIRNNFVFT